jgi:hypothetical protein
MLRKGLYYTYASITVRLSQRQFRFGMSHEGSESDDAVEADPYSNLPAAARLRDGESIDEFRQRTVFRHDLHSLPPNCFRCDDPSSSEADDEEMIEAKRSRLHEVLDHEARRTPLPLDSLYSTPSLGERMRARTVEGGIPSSNRGKYARPAHDIWPLVSDIQTLS